MTATQTATQTAINRRLALELKVRESQITATVALFDEGATVPFVARYRKEVTGGLDDVQLRLLDERLGYLRELEDRRAAVLASIEEQGKLDGELRARILAADTKTRLEDLYLPFKKKRRTKAQMAREAGLAPLAEGLLADPTQTPEQAAAAFVSAEKGVADVEAALDGARQILMETFAEEPELVGRLRELVWTRGRIRTCLASEDKQEEGAKFRDWFDHSEPIDKTPSHRALAFLRGRKDGILRVDILMAEEDGSLADDGQGVCLGKVQQQFGIRDEGRPADAWLLQTARLAWRVKISLHIETQLMTQLREAAGLEAISVFGKNLHDLLLAAPAGHRCILGLDPGLRTGCKVAVVDATGKVVDTATIYPTPPRRDVEGSLRVLEALIAKHEVDLVSIGNGTGSRETDRLVVELQKRVSGRKLAKVITSEAGASIYSASELGSRELPDLDVSLRGAVSIARRVQDPLAELVKIDPKSIGVGQYQHDVNQTQLQRSLDAVVEDCVNFVGVDLNTASEDLLARVSGLSPTLAKNIVQHRDENGAFANRKQLLKVARLGPKAFEQCAGFLRIRGGDNPLDQSGVHPEAYPVVERILARTQKDIRAVIGDTALLKGLDAKQFVDERFGLPTVTDILGELQKPGRDPRPEFKTATFQDGVSELKDLTPGMQLEGVVTNVTNFGAFVDIGVHQDGLVHISCLSESYVEDPRSVVKPGQVVKVKVLEVDLQRQRVALSMRLHDEVAAADEKERSATLQPARRERAGQGGRPAPAPRREEPLPNNPFAAFFKDKEKK